MSGCGASCVLFIWTLFLLPIIMSLIFLLIKKNKLKSKGRYFLVNTVIGYASIIGFNFLISFIVKNFIDSSTINMNILSIVSTILLFVPPIIFSYLLAKKFT